MYRVYVFLQPDRVTEQLFTFALPWLPEERRRKALRYRQANDRKNCVIAYLMLKLALKECFGIRNFTLKYGEYGKPYLVEYPDIYFNISHCSSGCAVVVADSPIGIDFQEVLPFSWEVASMVCCKQELELLEKSPDKNREFTRIWAMKESYVKMTGRGIGCDLTEINTWKLKPIKIIDMEEAVLVVLLWS